MSLRIKYQAKKNKNGTVNILLQYCCEGTFLKTTGLTLQLNQTKLDFFKKNQRIPSTILNYELLNEELVKKRNELESQIIGFFQKYRRYPTKKELESYLRFNDSVMVVGSDSLCECLKAFIEKKSADKDTKQYTTLLHHLEKYQSVKLEGKELLITDLTKVFFKEFFIFLSSKGRYRIKDKFHIQKSLCDNGIIKLSSQFYSAMNGIDEIEIASVNVNRIENSIKTAKSELKITKYENLMVVLSEHEVITLRNFNLSDALVYNKKGTLIKTVKTQTLERYKNLFLLQASVAQRHSDLHNFSLQNLNGSTLSILQKKTKNQTFVKINGSTIDLMKLSNSGEEVSNQKYNEYLKLVFEQFFSYYKKTFRADDITYKLEGIPFTKYYLGKKVVTYKKRFELMASHSARRTFVSVAKFEKGLTEEQIIKQTGHKNTRSLKPYMIPFESKEIPEVFDFSDIYTPAGVKKQLVNYDEL